MTMQEWVWGEVACMCQTVHSGLSSTPCLFWDYVQWGMVRQQLLDQNSADAVQHRKKGPRVAAAASAVAAAAGDGDGDGGDGVEAAAAAGSTAMKLRKRTKSGKSSGTSRGLGGILSRELEFEIVVGSFSMSLISSRKLEFVSGAQVSLPQQCKGSASGH
jgi:hypothetical protein